MYIANQHEDKPVTVRVLCNPAIEMISSLHVLADPSHHQECQAWAERTWKSLTPDLRSEITFFSEHYSQWTLVMDVICQICDNAEITAQEAIEKLGNMEIAEFAYWFLSGLIPRDRVKELIGGDATLSASDMTKLAPYLSQENVEMFLAEPHRTQKELASLLKRYWDSAFKNQWSELSLHIYDNANRQMAAADKLGWASYLESCHSDIQIIDDVITLRKQSVSLMPLDTLEEIIIVPSMFTAPHLMMSIHEHVLTVYRNLHYIERPNVTQIPEETDAFLRAINGSVRLKILRTLSEKPATTKELAQLYDLTSSTVSGHLKVMKEAKLVNSHRKKDGVYYYFNEQVYNDNIAYLQRFFQGW